MKHSIRDLLDVVYRYYPRGIDVVEQADIQRYKETEEYVRLVAARRRAAADERWPALLRRIEERFPSSIITNDSFHLPTGSLDACYRFSVSLPDAAGGRTLWFHIGFLVPYYFVYGWRQVQFVRPPEKFRVVLGGVNFFISRNPHDLELVSNADDERLKSVTFDESYIDFELSADELPCAEWIFRAIEATFGCERMPPEVGMVLVPDVAVNPRALGEARLYDCLFTAGHEWVRPSPCEVRTPGVEVDASNLTGRFAAVLKVLAALYKILWSLMPEVQGAFFGGVTTDGVLRKEEVLSVLAEIRALMDPPKTPRGIASKRELEAAIREIEALVARWDGEGEPPVSMVAWTSTFLANWLLDSEPKASPSRSR
ncbi:hypothetical protein BE21_11840 [Sorangium cellulosum]|uniref:Uncharacterized protein n=1 Tax=Sorangium cellulosum TaxID=56 RepID=A0A150U0H7_SORCE|nr:hypothetical protein BE21_11840 [Sorangium cellulosum]